MYTRKNLCVPLLSNLPECFIAFQSAPAIIGRMVPFAAVCAANCINIPMMRSAELANGIPVFDENGHRVGNSKKAAKSAITQVVISRIFMAMPGMCKFCSVKKKKN